MGLSQTLSDKEAVLFNPYVTVSNNKHRYSPLYRAHVTILVQHKWHKPLDIYRRQFFFVISAPFPASFAK